MNFLFGGKHLDKSGVFNNFTDYHCHILPGVDDGFSNIEDSLSALALYEQLGIRSVWLTPHIMEDIPNTPEKLQSRFEELKQAYEGSVELHLAAENMLDNIFSERMSSKQFLPMLGNRLLVETSYFNPPLDITGILNKIKEIGYIPLLAHPERYIYMDMSEYSQLKNMGVQFQLNLGSLAGCYGPDSQSKAEKLLLGGYYNFVGTDLHSLSQLTHLTGASVKNKYLDILLQMC